MTREELEKALDSGKLQALMVTGKWWTMRRNGRTQRWKRDPDRFRIPFKVGFRTYGALEPIDLLRFDEYYRINPDS